MVVNTEKSGEKSPLFSYALIAGSFFICYGASNLVGKSLVL